MHYFTKHQMVKIYSRLFSLIHSLIFNHSVSVKYQFVCDKFSRISSMQTFVPLSFLLSLQIDRCFPLKVPFPFLSLVSVNVLLVVSLIASLVSSTATLHIRPSMFDYWLTIRRTAKWADITTHTQSFVWWRCQWIKTLCPQYSLTTYSICSLSNDILFLLTAKYLNPLLSHAYLPLVDADHSPNGLLQIA